MKINWGTGIVIGILLFMGFIMFFVIKMSTSNEFDYDLVTEEYYEKELAYQQEIDAEKNLEKLSEAIQGRKTEEGWLLTFPKEMTPNNVTGTLFLYRPSNQKLDFELPLTLSNSQLLIPDSQMVDGRWNITIQWNKNGIPYLYKKSITY